MEGDPDDTQSFRIPPAVRAPVGVQLQEDGRALVRAAAQWLSFGLLLIVLDVGFTSSSGVQVDFVADSLGGIAILVGAIRANAVSKVTGPPRAGARAMVLAVMQLPLLLVLDVPDRFVEVGPSALHLVEATQQAIGFLGTAIVATILARAHDALGQLGRRDRWMRTRRTALVLTLLWLPLDVPAGLWEPTGGLGEALVGLLSIAVIVAAVVMIVQLARALWGSLQVHLPER